MMTGIVPGHCVATPITPIAITPIVITMTTITRTAGKMMFAITIASVIIAAILTGSPSASERLLGVSCVRLFPQEAGEVLINACDVCRRVGVERARPGAQFPTARTVIVPEQSRIALSFLGPGRTRVTSEEECRPVESGAADTGRSDGRRCVQFARARGAYLLVNGCGECRSIAVLRTDPAGRQSRGTYLVGPRSSLPYPADGAVNAALAEEVPCP
jgi:hypothetical protein